MAVVVCSVQRTFTSFADIIKELDLHPLRDQVWNGHVLDGRKTLCRTANTSCSKSNAKQQSLWNSELLPLTVVLFDCSIYRHLLKDRW
jgi:hypothetical protein